MASAPAEDHLITVIGAGPGGLQLGWCLERMGIDHVILEAADDVGTFFERFPRRRTLISFNRVHGLYDDPEMQLRWDWNALLCDYEMPFREFSRRLYPTREELVNYLRAFQDRYQLDVRLRTRVMSASRDEGATFVLDTADGRRFTSEALVVATGLSAPHVPDVPGMDLVTETYENVSLDPETYEGQRILVLGKGNSAFEIADVMLDGAALVHVASPRPIQFAWDTRHPGHLRANYTRLLDTYQLKLLNGTLDCTVQSIRREGDEFIVEVVYTHAEGEHEELVYDRVVRATGFRFDPWFLEEPLRPRMVHEGRLPAMTSRWEAEGAPDLWFAGTIMQARDFRSAASAFIDGFRYNVRTLARILAQRYAGQPFPSKEISPTPEGLAEDVGARICRTSGLWAQFGYLCDVVVVDDDAGTARRFEELPVDLTDELGASGVLGDHWYRITFEWGDREGDVFAIQRRPDHSAADESRFLHPVVRRFRGGQAAEEHHLLEDLFGMYGSDGVVGAFRSKNGRDPVTYHLEEHELPLQEFFAMNLARIGAGIDQRS